MSRCCWGCEFYFDVAIKIFIFCCKVVGVVEMWMLLWSQSSCLVGLLGEPTAAILIVAFAPLNA